MIKAEFIIVVIIIILSIITITNMQIIIVIAVIFITVVILVTVACQTLNQPSTHTIEKSFTHLLTTKVEHVTVLIKQPDLFKKNA